MKSDIMFTSKHPRDIFNEVKWRFDIGKCKIHYIHRGAPGDVKIIEGTSIKKIEKSFLVLSDTVEDAYIPYHRIFRIDYEDKIVFDKRSLKKPESSTKYGKWI